MPCQRGVDSHDERHPGVTRHSVRQEVDGFHMEVRRVEVLGDAHLDLVTLDVGERALD